MSDGPHKSLNMRRAWKRLAKVTDNPNSSDDEIAECFQDAHKKDWKRENCEATVKRIQDIVCDEQSAMFRDVVVEKLEELRPKIGGSPMGMLLLDCIIDSFSSGNDGTAAVQGGIENTLREWSARHSREMEEHYRRESTDRRAIRLRDRYEASAANANFRELAESVVRPSKSDKGTSPRKRTDLDDGVGL